MLTLTDSAAFEKYNATKEPKKASIFNVANLLFFSNANVHFVSPTIKIIDKMNGSAKQQTSELCVGIAWCWS